MNDTEESSTNEAIKAGVELVKTAYDDALKPASSEVGKALGTLGRAVNVALSPLRGLVWSWEHIEKYLAESVERKLQERKVPPEKILTPDPDIAVPAIEALRYSKLRENYANLIATAMNADTTDVAHPAFVEILKQLGHDEAKIIEFLPDVGLCEPIMNLGYRLPEQGSFTTLRHVGTLAADAGCKNEHLLPELVDNLCRLGLTEIPAMRKLKEDWRYDRIRALPIYVDTQSGIPAHAEFQEEPRMIGLTRLGASFRLACIGK